VEAPEWLYADMTYCRKKTFDLGVVKGANFLVLTMSICANVKIRLRLDTIDQDCNKLSQSVFFAGWGRESGITCRIYAYSKRVPGK
jgi:hypothetical protein